MSARNRHGRRPRRGRPLIRDEAHFAAMADLIASGMKVETAAMETVLLEGGTDGYRLPRSVARRRARKYRKTPERFLLEQEAIRRRHDFTAKRRLAAFLRDPRLAPGDPITGTIAESLIVRKQRELERAEIERLRADAEAVLAAQTRWVVSIGDAQSLAAAQFFAEVMAEGFEDAAAYLRGRKLDGQC